ncbi:MAG: hypothetical protein H6828_11165 [Planctomycetes bacterium]|nr:hypothetical protein [Planctomycetota bacterium]
MAKTPYLFLTCVLGVAGLAACGGGKSSSASGSAGSTMDLVRVSNGFGEILPHKTFKLDQQSGTTSQLISIRTQADLEDNVTTGNPILVTPVFETGAILPSGQPGSHFLYATFTRAIDPASVLSTSPGLLSSNNLTGSIIVTAFDGSTGTTSVVRGRAFVNGQTMSRSAVGSPPLLELQSWIELDANGNVVPVTVDGETPGLGFPGTEGSFAGAAQLVSPNTVVFVVDEDDDLTTHETFPAGLQIRMEINTSVKSLDGRPLANRAVACSTVGPDTLTPEVLFSPPPNAAPRISPGGGESDVDPLTNIYVEFSEPIQPTSLGSLMSAKVPVVSSAISVNFGPSTAAVTVPFHVRPISPYDLTTWELLPAFNFPGEGPPDLTCGTFNRVDVTVAVAKSADIAGNVNSLPGTTFFLTGEGPGVSNIPVTPDTIYLGRTAGQPGISVVDLNGFGAGTGNPTYDQTQPMIKGNSQYPNNPNVHFQGSSLIPALAPGTCTIDGGSAGVFTLAKDSTLNDKVVRTPVILSVGDMMLGWSLDVAFNNAPSPFGCQGQGGNLCAATGFKQITTVIDGSTLSPAALNPNGTQVLIDGGPNLVGWSPHPNPPPLNFPPLCVSPYIGGQEPTSVATPPTAANLLVPGDPFGNPALQVPPSGLLATQANVFFQGPAPAAQQITACLPYGLRQQIGHFLYVIDRARNEIVVLNSNRMTVIDRIEVPDPTSLAIGSNLDLLAVTNSSVGSVTFIDIDPSSASFHQVIKITNVGDSPRGIAWEPGNEDILVCNEGSNSVSILSAFSLNVRKEVISGLDSPFEVAITPRQTTFGLARNVYFAYILNRSGRVAVFESGPNTVNGWGYDDIVGSMPMTFRNPKTIQPDPLDLRSGLWIVHEGPLDQGTQQLSGAPDEGALTNIVAETGTPGQLILSAITLLIPQLRDIHYSVKVSIGEERLTGVPVDIAFDNLTNLGGIVNWVTSFSAGSPVPINGKGIVRQAGQAQPTNRPRFVFAAVPNPTLGLGGVDVILLDGAFLRYDTDVYEAGVQSITAPDTNVMMDYFRQ